MKDGGAKIMTGEGEGEIILEYQINISITFESTDFKSTYVIYKFVSWASHLARFRGLIPGPPLLSQVPTQLS